MKKARKFLTLVLAGAMTLSLTTGVLIGSAEEETGEVAEEAAEVMEEEMEDAVEGTDGRPTVGNGRIGFSTITLGSEFFSNLDDLVHERFEAEGYEVITVSCEGSASQQVTDIENLITMDCEAIFFFATDTEAITDVCIKAREAGIKMYGLACTMENTDAYDKISNTDQYASGVAAAELAADWIEEAFPDAEDGSIDVAIIVTSGTTDSNNRSDGEATITDICSKANLVDSYDLVGANDSNVKAQEYAEMMQSQYPDLKCIICYGCDSELGSNEVYMRDSSLDRDEFAIFGVDTSEAVYQEIAASADNESLIRGTVSLGEDLSINCWDCLTGADEEYMDENGVVFYPVEKITLDNLSDYYDF